MKLQVTCSDGEKFILSPFQLDELFISGLDENELAVVIDRADVESCIEIEEEYSS